MLYTNVNIDGRRLEFYEGTKLRTAYTVELGQMRIATCLTPIQEGFHRINFSEDGFLYRVDHEKDPLWLLLASANPERMRSDDENGITGRIGNIRYVMGSSFHLEDLAFGPNEETSSLDVVLVRMDTHDEAIFEVEYDTGAGTELWYYIVKGVKMYRVREFNDIAIVGKMIHLNENLLSYVYPRRPNVIDEEDVLCDFSKYVKES